MSRYVGSLIALICLAFLPVSAADDLPPRALARLGDYRFYHGDKLGCYAINHDGRRVATGDCGAGAEFDKVIVWDGTTGEELRHWQIPGGGISCLDLSPDGKRLAVGCCAHKDKPNDLFVYDVDSGELVHRLQEFTSGVTKVQFSLDGKRLLVSEGSEKWFSDPAVSCWDATTGKLRKRWMPPVIPPRETDKDYTTWTPKYARLSPDEQVVFWQLEVEVQTPKGSVDLAKRYSVLRTYDATTNKQIYELETNDLLGPFSADGKRFVLKDWAYAVYQTSTGKIIHQWKPNFFRNIVALMPDEKRVLATSPDGYRLWDFQKDESPLALEGRIIFLHCKPCLTSGNGGTLLTNLGGNVQLWDLLTGKEHVSTIGHRSMVESLWFSADGRTLVSQSADVTCQWNVIQAKQVSRSVPYLALEDELSMSLSPDGRLALVIAENERMVQVRETKDRKLLSRLEISKRDFLQANATTFSRAGDKLALQQLENVEWFDTKTGKRLGNISDGHCGLTPVLSPNGHLLAWIKRGARSIQVADTESGRLLNSLDLRPDQELRPVLFVFSPDSEYLAVCNSDHSRQEDNRNPFSISIFHVRNGKEVERLAVPVEDARKSDGPIALTFSPDNRLLAVAEDDNTVRVLEIVSGRTRLILSGHRSTPTALAFSPDGQTLASGGRDAVIYLWDVTGARTRASGKEFASPESSACWDALAGSDAGRAGEAMAALLRQPEYTVAFLKEKLRPVAALEEKQLARLLADLDADAFEKREAARRALAELGQAAEPALRRALKDSPPEAKRRIEDLLEKCDRRSFPPETLRAFRAVEVLEHLGTPEARRLLAILAAGAPAARLTEDAKASLKRLQQRH